MRRVAPDRPAIAVRVNSSSLLNGKPRLSICTVMMPHISQMAKPSSRLGIEIHRLRLAIFLPVDSQNFVVFDVPFLDVCRHLFKLSL